MIHPYIIKNSTSKLLIHDPKFEEDPKPILWSRNGLYGMIPIEVIRNELAHRADLKKMNINTPLIFHWQAVVQIPYETGLAMEKANGVVKQSPLSPVPPKSQSMPESNSGNDAEGD